MNAGVPSLVYLLAMNSFSVTSVVNSYWPSQGIYPCKDSWSNGINPWIPYEHTRELLDSQKDILTLRLIEDRLIIHLKELMNGPSS